MKNPSFFSPYSFLPFARCSSPLSNSAFLRLGNEAGFAFVFASRQTMFLGPLPSPGDVTLSV
jgi:hypothetical protein